MLRNSRLLIFIIIYLFSLQVISSQHKQRKILQEKRAIYLINILDQVEGFKFSSGTFKIGILGDEVAVDEFKIVALSRTIKARKIVVKKCKNIEDLKGINAVYVHQKDQYAIDEILDKIRGKSILLISEYNTVHNGLINLTTYKGDFFIEIDPANMARNGFKASPTLNQISSLSMKHLKELLLKSAAQKSQEKEQIQTEKEILEEEVEKAYTTIESKDEVISESKDDIYQLEVESKKQEDKLKEKVTTLKDFEKNYTLQQQLLDLKNEEVAAKKKEISIQDKYLKDQYALIEQQRNVLKTQTKELNNQNIINILFIVIGILFSGFMIFIIRVNINRKELLSRLKLKHKEVAKKSITLERQNKELEQFAYIASHDLQEPLHTVTSFADFMYEDYADKLDAEGIDNLNYIKQGCSRMEVLIKSLLDYSRIGSEKKLKQIDSKELVDTIIQDFNALIKETKAKVTFGEMPIIYAYSTELRMLFQNIISNAIKFRKPGVIPEVFIEGGKLDKTDEYSHRWQFKIKDNGIGIEGKHQKKIFEIFQRLHTREDYEGTGIGLAHCKKVIMFHHGEIWINSALGKGTIFNFTIQFNPEDYEEITPFSGVE